MASIIDQRATLIVFAKAPLPGQAKTRLIHKLGADAAAQLQARLIGHTLHTALDADVGPVELWCTPCIEQVFFRGCAQRLPITLKQQAEGDIGQKMLDAFSNTLKRSRHAVLIGTDCPELTQEDIFRAVSGLRDGQDAVLLPVEDGGYTLIALSKPEARVFQGIPWSTNRVMEQTRQQLKFLKWRWLELPQRWDLDRPEDYDRMISSGLALRSL